MNRLGGQMKISGWRSVMWNILGALMRVSGDYVTQVAIRGSKLQAGSRLKLADMLPVQLLPGRIVPGGKKLQICAALLDFAIAEKHVNTPIVKVHFDPVAGLQDRQVTSDGGFG